MAVRCSFGGAVMIELWGDYSSSGQVELDSSIFISLLEVASLGDGAVRRDCLLLLHVSMQFANCHL